MPKSNIKFIPIQNKSVIVHACFVLFIVCLYICVCECLLQNNNHKTKHKNNTNCGSAFEPGASRLPYYCAFICVRSWCNWRASLLIPNQKNKIVMWICINLCVCICIHVYTCTYLQTNMYYLFWRLHQSALRPRMRWRCCIALRTLEESLSSGAPKEEFGRMIFEKNSSLGDRTKVR